MNTICFYHNADFDGLLSREVVRFFEPEATLVGWNYGDPTPEVPRDCARILMVDISIPDLMSDPRLVWIDHHKTAIDQFGSRPGLQIDGVAACRLVWQWFRGKAPNKTEFIDRTVEEPELLRLAGEYDIWDHRDSSGRPLQFGLRAMDQEQFVEFAQAEFGKPFRTTSKELAHVIGDGARHRWYSQLQDAEFSTKCSQTVNWEGFRFCALNTGRPGNSDVFEAAVKPEEHDALLAWRYYDRKVLVSLYHAPHRKDLDLSGIAKKYGGGGHRGACGFRTTLSEMERILSQ